LQRAGAAVVFVYLPANQPGLAFTGAGLGSLRLGFAALLPRYGDLGDALVLQWVRNPDIDDSEWEYADERVAAFAHLVLDQARSLGEAEVADRRREARRQQLLAALPTDG
jgi:phenylpropionate dioxygenase-like ring-hydroxylating dioxygenase large terminal subunit